MSVFLQMSLVGVGDILWALRSTLRTQLKCQSCQSQLSTVLCQAMGPVRIRHSSHDFGWQSSHSVDLAGWQAKMASIEIWMP